MPNCDEDLRYVELGSPFPDQNTPSPSHVKEDCWEANGSLLEPLVAILLPFVLQFFSLG